MSTHLNIRLPLIAVLFCWLSPTLSHAQCLALKELTKIDESKVANLIEGSSCVQIDISESIQPQSKPFIYRWNLGDGTTKEGTVIDHCYPESKEYTATLTVIDPKNERIVFEKEVEAPITLQTQALKITTSSVAYVNQPIQLKTSIAESNLADAHFYWSIDDKEYLCGRNPEFTPTKEGLFKLKVLVEYAHGTIRKQAFANTQLKVKSRNTHEVLIKKYQDKELNISRFTMDPMHFVLINTKDHTCQRWSPEKSEYLSVVPAIGENYIIGSWRGTRFLKPVSFSTDDCSSQVEATAKLDSICKNMCQPELIEMKALYFISESDSLTAQSKLDLKRNVEIIKNNTDVTFQIGVYTHANSVYASAIAQAEKRQTTLRKELIRLGVNENQITVTDLHSDKRLINRCKSYNDCYTEENLLNERAEIIISGLKHACLEPLK